MILLIKVLSLLFTLVSACLSFTTMPDISNGRVLGDSARSGPRLDDANDTEVEALIDASEDKASQVSVSS